MRGSNIERRLVYVWGTMQEYTMAAWKTSLVRPVESYFSPGASLAKKFLFISFEFFHDNTIARCKYTYDSLSIAKKVIVARDNSRKTKPVIQNLNSSCQKF